MNDDSKRPAVIPGSQFDLFNWMDLEQLWTSLLLGSLNENEEAIIDANQRSADLSLQGPPHFIQHIGTRIRRSLRHGQFVLRLFESR